MTLTQNLRQNQITNAQKLYPEPPILTLNPKRAGAARQRRQNTGSKVIPKHCTLHPTTYTRAPYILHPSPYTLHPTPKTRAPYTQNPKPSTRNPKPETRSPDTTPEPPTPYTLLPTPCTPHPTPYSHIPYTPHLKPHPQRPTPAPYHPIRTRPQSPHPEAGSREN